MGSPKGNRVKFPKEIPCPLGEESSKDSFPSTVKTHGPKCEGGGYGGTSSPRRRGIWGNLFPQKEGDMGELVSPKKMKLKFGFY
jgi:hypothetical protein